MMTSILPYPVLNISPLITTNIYLTICFFYLKKIIIRFKTEVVSFFLKLASLSEISTIFKALRLRFLR